MAIFKKADSLNKANYRPVSILTGISKIYERVISDQLMNYCEHIMSDFLCAFRKEHGCHTVLLKLVEDWKAALDDKKFIGAMLMDLSRAFDCLPHRLLLAKLNAYGVDDKACNLLMSYLRKRQQRVKVGVTKSDWTTILKGIPQGSILGPLLFNIFINDLLFSLTQMNSCTIYNYADDNSIAYASHSLDDVKINIERSTEECLNWFIRNHMQANPAKFQSMILGNIHQQRRDTFTFKLVMNLSHQVILLNC
jgi:retron-type reverse transcriptase